MASNFLPMLAVLCSIKAATTEAVLFTMPETQQHRRAYPCTSLSTSFEQSHNEVALRDLLCARECKSEENGELGFLLQLTGQAWWPSTGLTRKQL